MGEFSRLWPTIFCTASVHSLARREFRPRRFFFRSGYLHARRFALYLGGFATCDVAPELRYGHRSRVSRLRRSDNAFSTLDKKARCFGRFESPVIYWGRRGKRPLYACHLGAIVSIQDRIFKATLDDGQGCSSVYATSPPGLRAGIRRAIPPCQHGKCPIRAGWISQMPSVEIAYVVDLRSQNRQQDPRKESELRAPSTLRGTSPMWRSMSRKIPIAPARLLGRINLHVTAQVGAITSLRFRGPVHI